jgi:glycolate oxidase FAD binding subunit
MKTSIRTKHSVIPVSSVEDVQSAVRAGKTVQIVGGGTKSALSTSRGASSVLDMRPLAGILAYDSGEYTFTALAGTRLSDVQAALTEHGQYMPFDPPLVAKGATLGGTVAAGLSGAGRQRYGGVRDFLIGVRFVDGLGRLVRGGGNVVKNAAGFDLPKLMVGSLGQLGVLTELSFKVFPQPPAYATLALNHDSVTSAMETLGRLATLSVDIDALDISATDAGATVWLRIGGLESTLVPRLASLEGHIGQGKRLYGTEDQQIWRDAAEFEWADDGTALVKVPLSPTTLLAFDEALGRGQTRRYSAGGNVAWLAWQGAVAEMDSLLVEADHPGLVLSGESEKPLIGMWPGILFYQRIKQTLDPDNKFPNYIE